jgi:p-hydroxybenzoate 3-monooxygenase
MKTQVVIIGAGPAGLLLGHLLRADGIECIIVERAAPDYVLGRIRAGVLERVTTDLLHRLGIDDRLNSEGMLEEGFCLASGDDLIRIDTYGLTGKHVTVYGQTEITRDLMDAAPGRGLEIIYEASNAVLHDVESDAPWVGYTKDGKDHRIDARFIAGCDGFHGASRKSVVGGKEFERVYPFGWLGILADVPPCHDELIYANHDRGFALASMRSKSRSRYYIDVPLSEKVEDWSDDRLWEELQRRLPMPITTGPALKKSIAPLRSFIFDKMRHGSLFLAGDAAHIVPPTGAKGLNLAASDVSYLSDALIGYFKTGDRDGIMGYSQKALARIWKASRFSWQLTRLMHRFADDSDFDRQMQIAELDYIASSVAAQTAIAENYVGLPL